MEEPNIKSSGIWTNLTQGFKLSLVVPPMTEVVVVVVVEV